MVGKYKKTLAKDLKISKGGNHFSHGMTKTFEYRAYQAAKRRCQNPNASDYAYYGGRGIEFHFASFQEFFAEVGPMPDKRMTLDRKKNDKHYERGNVKWATRREQANNRRERTPPAHSAIDGRFVRKSLIIID